MHELPDISAALIVAAGVLLMLTGALGSSLTEDSRRRLAGWGWALVTIGFVVWLFSAGLLLQAAFFTAEAAVPPP